MPVGSHGAPRNPASLLPTCCGPLDNRSWRWGGGAGMGLGKGISEPGGFELQVTIELNCHHGKTKAWKRSGWKRRVFPRGHSCQQVLEITHPLGSMQLEAFVSDLWPDLPNNFYKLVLPCQALAEDLIAPADLCWPL